MTAAGGCQGCEGMAAEFLFVLCKEDSARLIKYTGYGNAAGLLLTHGLLGGGKSETAADYSSDSESDTEDYVHSKPSIDPVTGGPTVERGEREGEREAMTEEEKEIEAAKLVEMMRRLNEQGVIRVLPLDSTQQDILSSDDIPLD
ncbi:Synembryn-A [Geodia barretti]|nr:Synembryn-A [Geodia barretti]